MAKTYTFDEFRWEFLSREVDRFDLRKLYDRMRYVVRQAFEGMEKEPNIEEREVREGSIVRILQIKNFDKEDKYRASYSLKNIA